METKLTVREFAQRMRIGLPKARQLAKDFLLPDPEATRQSGKARSIDRNEAFEMYLGHHLVTEMGFGIKHAKVIHKDIGPYLRRKGIYPIQGSDFDPDEMIDLPVMLDDGKEDSVEVPYIYDTIIHIMNANTESGFYYRAIRAFSRGEKKSGGLKFIRTEFLEEDIVEGPLGKKLLLDELNIRILNLNKLRSDFNDRVLRLSPY
jgi:hypothetical protein